MTLRTSGTTSATRPLNWSRLMRMQADPEPQRGPHARQFSRTLGFDGIFRRENAERLRQSGRLGSFDDLLQVLHKRVVRQMAMRVDHFADPTSRFDMAQISA